MENQPLVSIGVPVFNGEKGLANALDALIGQSYQNLEIIISDNGSTDATSEICEEYVRKDSRIKYYRSPENRGLSWNYQRVADFSSGKYFLWATHDDIRELTYVSACVEKMEQCPDAAVCQSHVEVSALRREGSASGKNEILHTNNLDNFEGRTDMVDRYNETLVNFPAMSLGGLLRTSFLRKAKKLQNVIGSDVGLMQEMSIYGRFVQVPKVLYRYIPAEKWKTVDEVYFTYFGKNKPWWYLPFVALFLDHWKRVAGSELSFGMKLCLWWVLIRYQIGQMPLKILIKVAGRLCPEKHKEKLGCAIYWRWMHSQDIQVVTPDFFLERVIKPRLNWWG